MSNAEALKNKQRKKERQKAQQEIPPAEKKQDAETEQNASLQTASALKLDNLLDAKDFHFKETVGEGNQAEVNLAEYTGTAFPHTTYAVKSYLRSGARGSARAQEVAKRAYQEWRELQELNHPALPKAMGIFHTVDEQNRVRYHLVMEAVQGKSLLEKITNAPQEATALSWTDQLLDFVQYMQEKQKAHRDIKPENIIIEPSGKLRVLDAGGVTKDISKTLGSTIMEKGSIFGTLKYAAPEQIDGYVKPNSDLYAVGIIMYEMLMGELVPGEMKKTHEKLDWQKMEQRFGKELQEIVRVMTRPDYKERVQTAAEVRGRLEKAVRREKEEREVVVAGVANEGDNFTDGIPEYSVVDLVYDHLIIKPGQQLQMGTSSLIPKLEKYQQKQPLTEKDMALVELFKERIRLSYQVSLLRTTPHEELLAFTQQQIHDGKEERILGYRRNDIVDLSDALGFSRPKQKEEHLGIHRRELVALNNPKFRELLQYCANQRVGDSDLRYAAANLRTYSREMDMGFDKEAFKAKFAELKERELTDEEKETLQRVGIDIYTIFFAEKWGELSRHLDAKRFQALFLTLAKEGLVYQAKGQEGLEDCFRISEGAKFGKEIIILGNNETYNNALMILTLATTAGGAIGGTALVDGSIPDKLIGLGLGSTVGFIAGLLASIGIDVLYEHFTKNTFNGSVIRQYSPEKKAEELLKIYQAFRPTEFTDIPQLMENIGKAERCELTPHQLAEAVISYVKKADEDRLFNHDIALHEIKGFDSYKVND